MVTVVGEIPAGTAERIALSMRTDAAASKQWSPEIEMFREHFNLQIPPKFFIGQSPSALALFVVPGTKIPAYLSRCSLIHIA